MHDPLYNWAWKSSMELTWLSRFTGHGFILLFLIVFLNVFLFVLNVFFILFSVVRSAKLFDSWSRYV